MKKRPCCYWCRMALQSEKALAGTAILQKGSDSLTRCCRNKERYRKLKIRYALAWKQPASAFVIWKLLAEVRQQHLPLYEAFV